MERIGKSMKDHPFQKAVLGVASKDNTVSIRVRQTVHRTTWPGASWSESTKRSPAPGYRPTPSWASPVRRRRDPRAVLDG